MLKTDPFLVGWFGMMRLLNRRPNVLLSTIWTCKLASASRTVCRATLRSSAIRSTPLSTRSLNRPRAARTTSTWRLRKCQTDRNRTKADKINGSTDGFVGRYAVVIIGQFTKVVKGPVVPLGTVRKRERNKVFSQQKHLQQLPPNQCVSPFLQFNEDASNEDLFPYGEVLVCWAAPLFQKKKSKIFFSLFRDLLLLVPL